MNIYRGYENLDIRSPAVTLGSFDGVHLGHIQVIGSIIRRAKSTGGTSVVITFSPHPRQVIGGKNVSHQMLTSLPEKVSLLEKSGIDNLIIIEFDSELSNMGACEFVEEVLVKQLRAKHLIIGFNQRFGRSGEGDFETVRKCGANHGLSVERVEPLITGGKDVSSSLIRTALLEGALEEANRLLGYHYFLNGKIIPGRKLGRELGFPTANIQPDYDQKLIPKDGVYAVEITVGGTRYQGMMSIGYNPTIDSSLSQRSIEANIFGFGNEIYGSEICVEFRYRLRDELKFDNLADLARQIGIDREMAIRLLS